MKNLIKTGYGRLTYIICENGTVYIDVIEIYPEFRNKGYGKNMLKTFIEQHPNKKINLCASTLKGSNMDRLIKFYESFGFIRTGKIDSAGGIDMTRNN